MANGLRAADLTTQVLQRRNHLLAVCIADETFCLLLCNQIERYRDRLFGTCIVNLQEATLIPPTSLLNLLWSGIPNRGPKALDQQAWVDSFTALSMLKPQTHGLLQASCRSLRGSGLSSTCPRMLWSLGLQGCRFYSYDRGRFGKDLAETERGALPACLCSGQWLARFCKLRCIATHPGNAWMA